MRIRNTLKHSSHQFRVKGVQDYLYSKRYLFWMRKMFSKKTYHRVVFTKVKAALKMRVYLGLQDQFQPSLSQAMTLTDLTVSQGKDLRAFSYSILIRKIQLPHFKKTNRSKILVKVTVKSANISIVVSLI